LQIARYATVVTGHINIATSWKVQQPTFPDGVPRSATLFDYDPSVITLRLGALHVLQYKLLSCAKAGQQVLMMTDTQRGAALSAGCKVWRPAHDWLLLYGVKRYGWGQWQAILGDARLSLVTPLEQEVGVTGLAAAIVAAAAAEAAAAAAKANGASQPQQQQQQQALPPVLQQACDWLSGRLTTLVAALLAEYNEACTAQQQQQKQQQQQQQGQVAANGAAAAPGPAVQLTAQQQQVLRFQQLQRQQQAAAAAGGAGAALGQPQPQRPHLGQPVAARVGPGSGQQVAGQQQQPVQPAAATGAAVRAQAVASAMNQLRVHPNAPAAASWRQALGMQQQQLVAMVNQTGLEAQAASNLVPTIENLNKAAGKFRERLLAVEQHALRMQTTLAHAATAVAAGQGGQQQLAASVTATLTHQQQQQQQQRLLLQQQQQRAAAAAQQQQQQQQRAAAAVAQQQQQQRVVAAAPAQQQQQQQRVVAAAPAQQQQQQPSGQQSASAATVIDLSSDDP
jgi:hypothetical protein